MASAIYLAPIVGGSEPKKQGLLVQLLFAAILVYIIYSNLLGVVRLWLDRGKLAPEVRKGGRRGPILVFTSEGEAGRAYLAMAREALKDLDAQVEAVAAGEEVKIPLPIGFQ